MALSAIQDKEQARAMRNFDQLKQRNEVNEMNKMSEMRELIKEENYKNVTIFVFLKDFAFLMFSLVFQALC